MKTIFIVITRSFITRNILRSGVLDLLKSAGYKVVVFFPGREIPKYLADEFEDEQVKLHTVPSLQVGRIHRRAIMLTSSLIFTDSAKIKILCRIKTAKRLQIKDGNAPKQPWIVSAMAMFGVWLLGNIYPLRPLMRFVELRLFTEKNREIESYFDQYKPDLVFSTSVVSTFDIAFMKVARRRGVKTVSMLKSWDNAVRDYYRYISDDLIVQNEHLVGVLQRIQGIPRARMHVVGVPQFDWYARGGVMRSREEHLRRMGFDPNLPLLFFGSEGAWAVRDHVIAEKIYEWVRDNELDVPCQLLVRPHYSNVNDDVFRRFRGKPGVVVDSFRATNFLGDSWDPTQEETIDFVNSVNHCAVMINAASTLSLDAACVDRPVINLGFGCEYRGGEDVTTVCLYGSDHYQWVLETGGTKKVNSFEELKEQINAYLKNPTADAEGRERLRNKLCYKVDGGASARLVGVLEDMLR